MEDVTVLGGITPSAIDVMGDKVLIFTYEEEPSSFFETMWKIAKN